MTDKESVRAYWNAAPCGTADVREIEEAAAFRELERQRDEREPFIGQFARFGLSRGKRLLEVGVGAGTDHIRFARAGAICTGVDLSEKSLETTRRHLQHEGLASDLRVADAEHLPFADATFEYVYSWGVIHHTPDTRRAAQEILRVLRKGGEFTVMVYNRHSLVAAQAWLLFAAMRGRPTRSLSDVLASHVESPGTKAYTVGEARDLFAGASRVHVETVVTGYDLRVGRRRFLPFWTHRTVPSRLGWFHVVSGSR
ncbi:MAG: class I SAM-dependent methyltransferase [Polyangiaceae bacterium]